MSLWSRIKSAVKRFFSGGSSSSSSSRASRVSNYGGGGSRSYSDYSGGGYEHEYQSYQRRRELERQERKKKQQATTNALASISKRTDSLSSGRSPSVASSATSTGNGTTRVLAKIGQKATPPDPKQKAKESSQERATRLLKSIDRKAKSAERTLNNLGDKVKAVDDKVESERKSYNKATGNRYNPEVGTKEQRARARQRLKSGEYMYDPNAEKWEIKHHPIAASASRGALSGVTFGGSELLAQKSKRRQESGVEQYYQKNKNKWAEMGGEIAGSLVGFGLTGEASAKAVGKLTPKAVKSLGARGTEKLASSAMIRRAAEKEAVKRFGVEGATKEVINQIARRRATTAMAELGKDAAINMTTGLASDLSHSYLDASKDGTFDRGEFAKSMGQNAALNTVLGGATSLVPAFRVGKHFDDGIDALKPVKASNVADNMEQMRQSMREAFVREGDESRRIDFNDLLAQNSPLRQADEAVRPQAVEEAVARNADEAVRQPDVVLGNGKRTYTFEVYNTDGRREIVTVKANKASEASNIAGEYGASKGLMWSNNITKKVKATPQAIEEAAPPPLREEVTPPPLKEEVPPPPLEQPKPTDRYNAIREAEREQGLGTGQFAEEPSVQEEAAQIVKEDFEQAAKEAEAPTAYEQYEAQQAERGLSTKKRREGERHAEAIQMALDQDAKKAERKAAKQAKTATEDVDNFASVDDASGMGFEPNGDAKAKVEAEVNKTPSGKSQFDKQRDSAYKEMSGTDLNTDGVEKWDVNEQRELIDKNYRTTEEHTKRGYTTIAVTGDKGFKGVAHQALENGETIVDVYHDKENLARGANRVMRKADKEGGVNEMIKDFTEYAEGKRKLNSNEVRDQLYDVIAAVDFANANKNEPWAADLYLAACKAGAEQTSVSGLSLRMWQKMAMSSPEHRAKAVRQQILEMFNKSKGMRKELGKVGKGNKITEAELKEYFKNNPALKDTLDALEKMGEATSVDEVQEMAEKALLQARKVMPMTAFDQLTQWRYVAMLSSPKTHVRNITSNIYSATLGQLRDGMASGIENGLIKNGKLDATLKKQGLGREDYLKSTGGLSGRAWKDSHVGLKAGTELNSLKSKLHKAEMELGTLSPSDKKAGSLKKRIADLESQVKMKQADYDKLVGGIKRPEAKKAQDAWLTEGYENLVANAEKFEKKVYTDGISKGAFKINDKLSKFIGNALETSDAISLERIFRERYDKILTANGWDALQKAAQGKGKEAKAAAARLKRLEEYAAQEASYIAATDTYRNYNALSSAMSKFVSDSLFNYDAPMYKKLAGGLLHATMPFTKVPVNLVKRGIDYSPVGLLLSKKSLNNAIASGNITEINRACERLAEGRIGTGIAALGAGLGFIDPDGMMINTRLDKNDTLDKRKKDAGYQDYSIQAAGRNITMEWLTPTSSTLFTGVEFGRLMRKMVDTIASDNGMTFDVAELTDIPINLASSLLEPSLQLSVFQGLNNSLENVVESDNYSDTNANPWLKMGTGVFGDYARSMMPTVVGQISRSMSPYDYFVTGDTDSIYGFNSTMAKIPFVSEKMFGAKTNSWGQIKNEKQGKGDYAKSFAKNLLSPANINKTTWDETDEKMMALSKDLGDEIFPKNNYDKELVFGRNNGNMNVSMTNKELAEYNVQRGKSGSDAMADALNTVVFNRWDKDEKGHRTIPREDNISDADRARLIKEYEGKGIKEVAAYIIDTPQFKNATPAEQRQTIKAIYGTNSEDDSDESKGAKRYAERYIAGKHGISADEYDYYNEVPRNAQELLAPAIESGLITYGEALEFKRGAGKTYYTTDERGEKGGTVTTRYNKKEMMAYLESAGYTEEQAEALYNAFKQSNAKEYGGSSSGYRRRRGRRRRGYRRYSGGGSTAKAEVPKPKTIKANSFTQGEALVSKRSSSSAKVTPPTLKRVQAKIDLPTKR